MSKKILIIGRGFLGTNIVNVFGNYDVEIFSASLSRVEENQFKVDITNLESIEKCMNVIKPNFVINCAAKTDIDYLEKNPTIAYKINAEGAKNIAKSCNKFNSKLIQISTDSIFDGTSEMYEEDFLPNPINVYSKSKLRGEQYISENLEDYIIIRTNFFGIDDKNENLLNWILQMLQKNNTITGFIDVIFNPLEIQNLCKIIFELMISDYKGIIHLSNKDVLSKYDFAILVAGIFGYNKKLIKKGSIDEMSFVGKRPKNTSLSNKKSRKFLKTEILPIKESLTDLKIRRFDNC